MPQSPAANIGAVHGGIMRGNPNDPLISGVRFLLCRSGKQGSADFQMPPLRSDGMASTHRGKLISSVLGLRLLHSNTCRFQRICWMFCDESDLQQGRPASII
jgi:hypothetical protein